MIKGHGDDIYCYSEDIKMNFSSNICPSSGHDALLAHLFARGEELISRYPEPEAWSLEKMLAERLNISPKNVIVTNGATEAIYLIAKTFRSKPVIPSPTFREYEDACWDNCLSHPKSTTLWLCNPNNPTGKIYEQAYIDEACRRYNLVIIDQSYEHYTSEPIAPPQRDKMKNGENVLRVHSMTKTYAIPGLRLGYIIAPLSLSRSLRRHLYPWAVNSFAIEAGKFLLEHDEEFRVRPDFAEVQRLWQALNAIPNLELLPTQTNFMLCRIKNGGTASELKEYLARHHGILIRDASNFRGLTPHHFRIASQSPEENDALVAAITQFLQQQ